MSCMFIYSLYHRRIGVLFVFSDHHSIDPIANRENENRSHPYGMSPNGAAVVGHGNNVINMDLGRKQLDFSPDHVQCLCEALQQKGDVEKLATLLWSLPSSDFIRSNESILRWASFSIPANIKPPDRGLVCDQIFSQCILILFKRNRARAIVAYHRGLYHDLYQLLESHCFAAKFHTELQLLWFKAHYKEAEKVRGRKLGAVDKYRIRKKYPLPKTIWDGEETVYCFKEKSRNALKDCYDRNRYTIVRIRHIVAWIE